MAITIYNVNLSNLGRNFLNYILKKPKMIAWCGCLIKPIQEIHTEFLAFRIRINEDLTYNSQTILFEYLLNKKFNNGNPGIWIENTSSAVPDTFVYDLEEDEPILPSYDLEEITPENAIYTYDLSEFETQSDFVVHIPITTCNITTDLKTAAEIHATIKKYKYAGKRYNLKNF